MSHTARNCLLLVEDDALVRSTVAMLLEDDGFGVIEAPDAGTALQLVHGGLDAVVMVTDVDLGPGPNGAELATELRRLRPEMGVVFITGRTASLAGRALGPREAVLAKPFEGRALSQIVRRLTS